MTAYLRDARQVATAVARRSMIHATKNPALLLPSILFPLIFLIAFAGGLSAVSNVPGFDFPSGYTAFQFVFVFLQSAAFGGVFTGFGVAADFQFGFAQRLLLGAPNRVGLIFGYVVAGALRWLMTASVITVAALISGMQIDGSGVDLVGLIGLALLVSASATLFAAGVAFRARSLQAGPLMQMPVFLILFLAPVYVPLHLLKGWIHAVASINPATALVQAGRGFISGAPQTSALAYLAVFGLIALAGAWCLRGLQRAERET